MSQSKWERELDERLKKKSGYGPPSLSAGLPSGAIGGYIKQYRTYKTVFQLVYENTTEDAEEAEARAIAQLKLIVGEKGASHIMSRNYPVTTEMEK